MLETLTYKQKIGSDCIVTREYQVKGSIADLLDCLDADSLFSHTKENSEYIIETPNESSAYRIAIDFKKGPQRIVAGSFDKNGLPNDWPEFAEDLLSFISFYGQGELVNSVIYDKAKRRRWDFIFCSVTFEKNGKDYYYLANDDEYEVGDYVFVPSGIDGQMKTVKIVKIEYFPEEDIPYPVSKMKHIISKCQKDEFEDH